MVRKCLEFASQEFKDFFENFNIKISTTPGESPWCNDIFEQQNATLTEILLMVKEDTNCPRETALAWAVNAKNSFINVSGYSLHYLVSRKNISLPSSLNDELIVGYLENPQVLEHLNTLLGTYENLTVK